MSPQKLALHPGRAASLLILIAVALIAAAIIAQSNHISAHADDSRNGEISPAELSEIEPGYHLIHDAAAAYREMIAALRAAGHDSTLNSAYRTLEQQQELIDSLGLLEDGGTAARLGTSEHGDGIAVDLVLDWDALAWMRENAADFGFAETIESEPWHWAYVN